MRYAGGVRWPQCPNHATLTCSVLIYFCHHYELWKPSTMICLYFVQFIGLFGGIFRSALHILAAWRITLVHVGAWQLRLRRISRNQITFQTLLTLTPKQYEGDNTNSHQKQNCSNSNNYPEVVQLNGEWVLIGEVRGIRHSGENCCRDIHER